MTLRATIAGGVAVLACAAACESADAPRASQAPAVAPPNPHVVPRSTIDHAPAHGLVYITFGIATEDDIVVDCDAGTIHAFGYQTFGKPRTWDATRALAPDETARLARLAVATRREGVTGTPSEATDNAGKLAIVDGDDAFLLEGRPVDTLGRAAAAELVGALDRAAAFALAPGPAPAPPPGAPVAHRADLPADVQAQLPAHGLYAAGGGAGTANAWRIVVDTDGRDIRYATDGHDADAGLTVAQADELVALANAAWAAGTLHANAPAAAVLVVVSGDDALALVPVQPAAAKVLAALRRDAGW